MEKMPVGVQNCASWKKKKNDKTTTIADNQSENPRKKKTIFQKNAIPRRQDFFVTKNAILRRRIAFLLVKMLFQ